MQGSAFEYLKPLNKIVLAAGHGGDNTVGNRYDPGAVNGDRHEARETQYLTEKIAEILRKNSIAVDVVPHNLNLGPTIDYLNRTYPDWQSNNPNKVWVIEIHRDWNNPNIPDEAKNNQVGVYYWGDANGDNNNVDDDPKSREIADGLLNKYLEQGAFRGSDNRRDFNGSWAKDHFVEGSGFHLGFIHRTNQIAHLIELGFMSGRGDNEHLDKLAQWTAVALYEVFTGQKFPQQSQPKPPVIETPKPQEDTISRKYALNILFGNDTEKDRIFVGENQDIHQWISSNDFRAIAFSLLEARKSIKDYQENYISKAQAEEESKQAVEAIKKQYNQGSQNNITVPVVSNDEINTLFPNKEAFDYIKDVFTNGDVKQIVTEFYKAVDTAMQNGANIQTEEGRNKIINTIKKTDSELKAKANKTYMSYKSYLARFFSLPISFFSVYLGSGFIDPEFTDQILKICISMGGSMLINAIQFYFGKHEVLTNLLQKLKTNNQK